MRPSARDNKRAGGDVVDETKACANINAKGRRRRMFGGVVALTVNLAWFVVARRDTTSDAWRIWTIAGFFLTFYGWLGVLQATADTCVVLAAKGTEETDAGTAPVADADVAKALRRRANGVWLRTLVATAATAGILWLLK